MQKQIKKVEDKSDSRELLKSIVRFMKLNQELSLPELVALYSEVSPQELVPISIFSTKLSPSESLCKYLKGNRNLSFHAIAVLLGRDDRSIWTSYARASKKTRVRFKPEKDDLFIPLEIFADRKKSILEHVVDYMVANYRFSNSKISRILKKNQSAIITVAKRAQSKEDYFG